MKQTQVFLELNLFFLNKRVNKLYFQNEKCTIYFTKTKRLVEKNIIDFVTISYIVVKPKYQNKGLFTSFFEKFKELYPDRNLYIESILDQRFYKKLLSLGFKDCSNNAIEDLLLWNVYFISSKRRVCCDCHTEKDLDDFYSSKPSLKGNRNKYYLKFCKECHKQRMYNYRLEHIEEVKKYQKEYQTRGKENLDDWYVVSSLRKSNIPVNNTNKKLRKEKILLKRKIKSHELEREKNCIGHQEKDKHELFSGIRFS